MFRLMGYKQEVTNLEPYIITLSIKKNHLTRWVQLEHLILEIEKAIKQYGAIKNQDYKIQVYDNDSI